MASINLFGEPVTVTKTNSLLITSVKALLKRRTDLTCTIVGAFSGHTDCIEPTAQPVSTAWVVSNIIDSGLRRTRRAYLGARLGAQILHMGNPSYDVLVTDNEHPRRKAVFDALPSLGPTGFAAFQASSGIRAYLYPEKRSPKSPTHILSMGTLIAERAKLLERLADPMDFDEEASTLAELDTPDALAMHLHTRGVIVLVNFDEPQEARPGATS
jgi:hypothetical protein